MTVITFDAILVTAKDAQPFAAPHRMSRVASKDSMSWNVHFIQDGEIYPDDGVLPESSPPPGGVKFGDRHVVGVLFRVGGNDASQGVLVEAHAATPVAMACTEEVACSEALVCITLDLTEGNISNTIRVDDGSLAGDADGDYTLNTYVQLEGTGWV